MGYADVAVNSPIARRRAFSYAIPPGLNVNVGQAVWVPFGNKTLQGVVLELTDQPGVENTRDITGVIESRPLLTPYQVALARWISDYYLSPLFNAVALMLPPGFERKIITRISGAATGDEAHLDEEPKQVLDFVRERGSVTIGELEKAFGKTRMQAIVAQLAKLGLVNKSYELEKERVKAKTVPYLRLAVSPNEAHQAAESLRARRRVKPAALLDFLAQQPGLVAWTEARRQTGVTKTVADGLVEKGLVAFQQVEVRREPISYENITPSSALRLTAAQSAALERVKPALQAGPAVFLLHGVTGSGKTEVYLQALAEAINLGKRGIVLVPEISLTPQTIERFASRFPHKVAVLHSRLSLGEQFDEWQRIRDGEFDVVVGPRSALFAPQPNLGIVVIDEEHEWTYKQQDTPHYHARDAAIKLAELTGAVVVLGSATPDVGTYYHAERGDYQLLRLPERVTPTEGSPLPAVQLVDLKDELKAGNLGPFSRDLVRAVTGAVAAQEQVILFLNRRGAATFIQCRKCGFVFRCRRCEIALTYHSAENRLVCHQCNYRMAVPYVCPQCHSNRIKFLGTGTQKLEEEAGLAFPHARLLRWDSDVTQGKHAHEEILHKFRDHEADILIGTQMVAKGLDLPLVTLVGVVNADIGLNLPDFRAGERIFQLLSQVAGRAGRGTRWGRVIIQTYAPEHYAIQAASGHDYAAFYRREIGQRRDFNYPPFGRLAYLTYSHINPWRCQQEAERVKRLLVAERDARGIAELAVLGPAPAFAQRRRGRFRWQIVLKGADPTALVSEMPLPQGWSVDIDPVGLT